MVRILRSGKIDTLTRHSGRLAQAATQAGKVLTQVAKTPMHPFIKTAVIAGACVVAVGVGVAAYLRQKTG